MIHTEKAVRHLQAVAMLVASALFLWSIGLPTFFRGAEAASLISASDTLSNSAPNAVSNHTITFTLENGVIPSAKFRVTFDALFTMGSVSEADIDILIAGTSSSTQAGQAGAAGTWGVDIVGNSIDFTAPTDQTVASSTEISILIGTNATGGVGNNQITNPNATTSYPIDIGKGTSTIQDSGQVRVAIIDEVQVSATVNTSLTFEVSGVSSGATVNSSPTTTVAATTNTTLPFGTLNQDESATLAHKLNVTTNAASGYSVTVALSGTLRSSTGAVIDSFVDGADTTTPQGWVGPGANVANDKTWGHWGVTSDDSDTTFRGADEFGADEWVGLATSTPTIVMGHDNVSDGTAVGNGEATVGYQIEISALQEAGDDYNTTLRYIATPVF